MLCKIADLFTEVPTTGGMSSRCREYVTNENVGADIVICADRYDLTKWPKLSYDDAVYMASGVQFYHQILKFNGLMLHSSAVELDGKAYLFSGQSGMGKSTHTKFWQQLFGENAKVFNDDKPALRRLEDRWYAYGTPWCGKDGININAKVPIAGICFLQRGEENKIRRLSKKEATFFIISQTMRWFKKEQNLDMMLNCVNRLVAEIPIYELFNKPEISAAQLSYETMRLGAEEANL